MSAAKSSPDSVRRPSIRIKSAHEYYFQGDQVSGEVLLDVPFPIPGVGCLELKAWAEEKCKWMETNRKVAKGRKPHTTTFHGGKDIYRSIVPLHEIVQGNLAAGRCINVIQGSSVRHLPYFIIPALLIYCPHIPDLEHCTSFRVSLSTSHLLQARLVPQAEVEAKADGKSEAKAETLKKSPTAKSSKIEVLDIMDQPDRECHYIAETTYEFTVLEKPGFQASLKPYSWQCTYSIPHALLGSGDLVMTIKKRYEPCAPGEEVPLWIDFQNQSQAIVTDVIVTLRHTLSTRSHSGTFKQITYDHTQWRRPIYISGSKKTAAPAPISFPLQLPPALAPTSHGTCVSSDWEVNVLCRYRGKWTVTHHTTDSDITFPLTIWATDLHSPRCKEVSSPDLSEATEKNDTQVEENEGDQNPIQTSLAEPGAATTVWPPVSFELSSDGGKPQLADIVRLLPAPKIDDSPCIIATIPTYKTSSPQCRLDLGLSVSTGLEKSLALQQEPLTTKPRRRSRGLSEPPVRRKIAPLQK